MGNLPSLGNGTCVKINEFVDDIVIFDTRQDVSVQIVLSVKLDLFCEKKSGSEFRFKYHTVSRFSIHY